MANSNPLKRPFDILNNETGIIFPSKQNRGGEIALQAQTCLLERRKQPSSTVKLKYLVTGYNSYWSSNLNLLFKIRLCHPS